MRIRSFVICNAIAMAMTFSAGVAYAAQQQGDGQAQEQTQAQGRGRGQGRRGAAEAPSPTKDLPFGPHDLSGVWLIHGHANFTLSNEAPPMTPWAQAKYDANKPGIGPRAQPLGNDPIMICDPIGFPRILFYGAYPLEFIQTSDRIIQSFDFFYTNRTIWMDGRQLPKEVDEPRFYGYAVGHWDGDTLVVDSKGYDDRDWLDADGHPHSTEMQIEERYHRVDHDDIEVSMTLTDPKAYTKPWVSEVKTLRWDPRPQEMREDVCVTSDELKYKDEVREPAGTPEKH